MTTQTSDPLETIDFSLLVAEDFESGSEPSFTPDKPPNVDNNTAPDVPGFLSSLGSTGRTPTSTQLVKQLTGMYGTIGTVVMLFDPECGNAVLATAEECAQSIDALARTNPKIMRVVRAMVETGAWGAVIAAHAPILMAVVAHHLPARGNLAPVADFPTNGDGWPDDDDRDA